MNKYLIFALALLTACTDNETGPRASIARSASNTPTPSNVRVKVVFIDVIQDDIAYGSKRGVYVITDSATGKEYIGVSGIGITETGSHSDGKYSQGDER